jgi:hypothetical protein
MRYNEQDWRSWTLADQRTFQALKAQQLASVRTTSNAAWSATELADADTLSPATDAEVAEAEPEHEALVDDVEEATR